MHRQISVFAVVLGVVLSALPGCSQQRGVNPEGRCAVETISSEKAVRAVFPYALDSPSRTLLLPNILKEISGLTQSADGMQLVAVQDELGTLFFLSPVDGRIQRELSFGARGDYEGVEIVHGDFFIALSSGALVRVSVKDNQIKSQARISTFLQEAHDVEGLAYDASAHQLLLACKGRPAIGNESANKKAIYRFDIRSSKLDAVPALCITGKSFMDYLSRNPKYAEKIDMPIALDNVFNPSGIAIHPKTGHWYVLSAKDRWLMCIDSKRGEILHLEKLKGKLFEQPEGICFDASGTLFIASEGKKGNAVIQVFDSLYN